MSDIIWYNVSMTSNTTPSPYMASADSEYSSTLAAWKAFNGTTIDDNDRWRSTGTGTKWIQLDFGKETIVDRFSITSVNSSGNVLGGTPLIYKLMGSLNATNWTEIKNFSSFSFSAGQTREFIVGFNSKFRYYRLEVSSPQSGVGYVNIGEIKFGYTKPPINKTFILHDGEYKKWNIVNKERNRSLQNLTSINDFTVFSSGDYESNRAKELAFDGIIGNYTNGSWASKDVVNSFLGLTFNERLVVNRVSISAPSDVRSANPTGAVMPRDFIIQGSDDFSTWIDLHTVTGQSDWFNSETRNYEFENRTPYKSYRMYVTGYNRTSKIVYVSEMELYTDELPSIESNYWFIISQNLPTSQQFISDGMDSLSPLLDRKVTTIEPLPMTNITSTVLVNGEEGKVYSRVVDLNKYLDIRSMKVEVK